MELPSDASCVMCSGVERGSAASHRCGGPVQGDGAGSTAAAAAGHVQGRPRLGRPRRGGQGTHDEFPFRCMPRRPLLHPGEPAPSFTSRNLPSPNLLSTKREGVFAHVALSVCSVVTPWWTRKSLLLPAAHLRFRWCFVTMQWVSRY